MVLSLLSVCCFVLLLNSCKTVKAFWILTPSAAPLSAVAERNRQFRRIRSLDLLSSADNGSFRAPVQSDKKNDEPRLVHNDSFNIKKKNCINPVMEAMAFATWCILSALALISLEDSLAPTSPTVAPSTPDFVQPWGSSTIKGLGFGKTEREQLAQLGYADDDPMVATLPSYNEIMLRHRTVHVERWAGNAGGDVKDAIHTMCSSLQRVYYLNDLADQYGWTEMVKELHKSPIADLSFAAADLGRSSAILRETAGFDWGSCAWRHCGALADAQEAMDELDHMLGVLEPFEVRFCLDIVERSLRDILAVVDWSSAATDDRLYYETLPKYESMFRVKDDDDEPGGNSVPRSIDDAYLRALQELRVD